MIENRKIISKLMLNKTGKMKSYIAILLVSIGKDNFEGEALKAALKMINQEFKGCCIAVADTLQRYNFITEKNMPHEKAYHTSLKEGEIWIEKYQDFFETYLTVPYEIIRWNFLINDINFYQKDLDFNSRITENSELNAAMKNSIEEYGKRLKKRLGEEIFNQVSSQYEQNCFFYLKEECVALSLLPKKISLNSNDESPIAIVYPGKSTAILTENREQFIKNEYQEIMKLHSDFLNWIPYRFNKIKQFDDSFIISTNFNKQNEKIDFRK